MSQHTPEDKILYPNHLRRIREHLGVKVIDMARKIGVSVATIYRWEAGTHYCNIRGLAHRMFDAYQTKPEDAYPTCHDAIFGDIGLDQMA